MPTLIKGFRLPLRAIMPIDYAISWGIKTIVAVIKYSNYQK
jgi:hypothetical protein